MKVGVLALQGDFLEHLKTIERCGQEGLKVRSPEELAQVDCLIIPGGESTTIGTLMQRYGLLEAIQERVSQGMPVMGTCAGAIVLAKSIEKGKPEQPLLKVMDIHVIRNAFGRQVDSFEADVEIPKLGQKPFRAVFIRAPIIASCGEGAEVMATLDGKIILAQQGNLIASAFHPELTEDTRLHEYFFSLCKK